MKKKYVKDVFLTDSRQGIPTAYFKNEQVTYTNTSSE